MLPLSKDVIPAKQRYLVSCILFILLFCWFNYFFLLRTKVVQVDIDISVSQAGTLKIYSPQVGGYSETNRVLQKVTPYQNQYSLRIPCQTDDVEDVHLMIAPIGSAGSVTLHQIDILLPFFKKISLDLPAHFKEQDNFVNFGEINILPGGGVKITGGDKKSFFFVREKLKLSPVPVVTGFISLCFCMWLLFHPNVLKGNRNGGLIVVEILDSDWRFVDSLIMELEKCCHDLVLNNSSAAAHCQSMLFSFTQINETKFAEVRSSLEKEGLKITFRMQMNRSGEI